MDSALFMLVFTLCLCALSAAQQAARGPWEPLELSLTAQGPPANPYVQGLPSGGKPYVLVTFTGMGGEAKGQRLTVPGFWDGGQTWKVRFAPPAPGAWYYLSASADPGLRGVTGMLRRRAWEEAELVANPTRRGLVRVHQAGPRAGRYFEYADGTPFLWIGDTWWHWAKRGAPFWERAQRVIDDRAARGFSVGLMLFGANAVMRLAGPDYQTPDFELIRSAERAIGYANSRGIVVWVAPWWGASDLPSIGMERIWRWSRYVVHRLASYNVIWNVGSEYNVYDYGGMGLAFWRDLGARVHQEDPYHHAIGLHSTPPTYEAGEIGDSAQWSTGEALHDASWLDFSTSQTGHGRWQNELAPRIVATDYARLPPKPTLVAEPWYEFIEGSAPAMDVRFAAWSAILSGAAGHTYGGGHQWRGDAPDPSLPQRDGHWPGPPRTMDSLDFPGAASIGYMAQFLRSIEWWKLEPHPELVSEYPQPFAAAVPGQEYVVYARYGGKLGLDLRAAPASDEFRYTWIDLTASKEAAVGTVNGGAVRPFHTPEKYPGAREYKDWLLHVRR
jgi:hypothetical protein